MVAKIEMRKYRLGSIMACSTLKFRSRSIWDAPMGNYKPTLESPVVSRRY